MAAMKLVLRERMHTINTYVVKGHSYKEFPTQNLSYEGLINFQI